MVSHLKVIQGDKSKDKSSDKVHQAAEEVDYLITFNWSITPAMSQTMQDLSESVFINAANLSLAGWDSYMDYLQAGIKQDTPSVLRTTTLIMSALFLDHLISKTEDICQHEDKRSARPSHKKSQPFYPYRQSSR